MSASTPKATELLRRGKLGQGPTCGLVRDILPHICGGIIPLGTGRMAIGIGRRQFMSALGGAAATWPLAARPHHRRGGIFHSIVGYLKF